MPSVRGAPADGHQHGVALDRRAVRERHPGDLVARDRVRLHSKLQLDPGLLEAGGDLVARELLEGRDQPVLGLHQGDAGSKGRVGLGQLASHRPAAQHEEPAGDLGRGRGLAVGPGGELGEAVDRRHHGRCAGGDHHRLAGDELGVPGPDAAVAVQPSLATEQLDAPLLQPGQLARVVTVLDHLVAAGQDGRGVQVAAHRLRRARYPARLGQRLRRAQQGLRRHARVIRALAPDQVALDDRHLQPALGDAPGADLAGRARSHNDDVELQGAHPRKLRKAQTSEKSRSRNVSVIPNARSAASSR